MMYSQHTNARLPSLTEVTSGIPPLNRLRLITSLMLPFVWTVLYFVFATVSLWPLAVFSLVALSFVTYGSISHDLVHGNLGLRKRTNSIFLSAIELLALRSGHAYRLAHLHHHARFPHEDDIEGAGARMSFLRALLEGVFFPLRIWLWALQHSQKDRRLIICEGAVCGLLVVFSIVLLPLTRFPAIYCVVVVIGSWIIPVVTSYIPHCPEGLDELRQTRRFRGKLASILALEHLYHLEHHLYPAVPHHQWPELARRLDPYLDEAGIQPVKLWF